MQKKENETDLEWTKMNYYFKFLCNTKRQIHNQIKDKKKKKSHATMNVNRNELAKSDKNFIRIVRGGLNIF